LRNGDVGVSGKQHGPDSEKNLLRFCKGVGAWFQDLIAGLDVS
jgi:hypothetical protein